MRIGLGIAVVVGLAGCTKQRESPPTYYASVAPIIASECRSCHLAGGIAPFALETYDQAYAYRSLIRSAVAERTMPPWGGDDSGRCQTFQDDKYLSDDEVATIVDWVDGGAKEGDSSVGEPETPEPPALPRVDAVAMLSTAYTPVTDPVDDYRCFVVDPEVETDAFVTGYEVHPGDARVVHHLILYSVDSAGEASAAALDAQDATPGYDCIGELGFVPEAWLAGWVPGDRVTIFPEGTGLRITGGRRLVLQAHYNTAQGAFPDQTSIDLMIDSAVEDEARIVQLPVDLGAGIPPGESYVEVSEAFSLAALPFDATLHSIIPHMHKRGRTMKVEREDGGDTACLLDVPRYDFNWQATYRFDDPLLLQQDADVSIRVTCGYDTTDDTEPVQWGEGTGDEMCLAVAYISRNP